MFDLRSDFPNQWHGFLTSSDHQQSFEITQDRFPYMFQGKGLDVQEVTAHGVPKDRTSEIRVQDWIGPMRAVGPLQLTAPVAEAETIAGLDTIIVVLRYQIATAP